MEKYFLVVFPTRTAFLVVFRLLGPSCLYPTEIYLNFLFKQLGKQHKDAWHYSEVSRRKIDSGVCWSEMSLFIYIVDIIIIFFLRIQLLDLVR